MTQKISEPVSVELIYDHRQRFTIPRRLFWKGRSYPLIKLGLHHTFRRGKDLHHIFSVSSAELFFRLRLDTTNLSWTLEELSDGLPD